MSHASLCSLDLLVLSFPLYEPFYLFFPFLVSFELVLPLSFCASFFLTGSAFFPLALPVSNFVLSCSFSHFFLLSSHLNFSLICLCVIRSSYFLLSLTFGLHFSSFNFFCFCISLFFPLPVISLYCIFFLSRRLK